MVHSRRKLGDLGERLAVQHLLAKGYSIRELNFRTCEGEIDIIAENEGTLAFVEVKTRRGLKFGTAAEAINPTKQRRLVALAAAYGQQQDGVRLEQRIDVIALDLSSDGRLISLQHLEGAVEAE